MYGGTGSAHRLDERQSLLLNMAKPRRALDPAGRGERQLRVSLQERMNELYQRGCTT